MYKTDFDGLLVTLASVEDIESWSHGPVTNPDTVNYRTGKPKQGGLFCEAIFGPTKNYECGCGKYKGVRYKWIVCERCGVEVTNARVRRSRMGHIDLAVPVMHTWYKASSSGGVHQLLELSSNEISKILTFVKYAVIKEVSEENLEELKDRLDHDYEAKMQELKQLYQTELDNKSSKLKKTEIEKLYEENKDMLKIEFNRVKSIISDLRFGSTILESDYRNIFYRFADVIAFSSGPEAILKMLMHIDVEKEIAKRVKEFVTIKSQEKRKKAMSLIKLLINLYVSGVKPEHMILKKLPVIPPDLRPVVQLDGGRFASSDVNLFYRRVLMRNIRLKKMIQVGMPDVVKKNEIRLLQESVNNLLVGEKGNVSGGAGIKVFKSLSDMLSGKEGIFRKNLLGKRVDYSGRSIITVGPDLKLNECGLPLYIAVKMFTPFIMGKLIEKKIVYTPKQAEKLIKEESPVALKFLEEVIKDKYVLLNRAPTLHRLSIEAFKIRLMPGKTIRIHPLVCTSFNADFDGDQMAVHLPISDEAQQEARELIAADKNILKPGSGEPTIAQNQDTILGAYYLTDYFDVRYPECNTEEEWKNNAPLAGYYSSMDDVLDAYANAHLHVKDKVVMIYQDKPVTTNVGRVVFNTVLPEGLRFQNKTFGKKQLKLILSLVFDEYDMAETVRVADDIKDLWFRYATLAAISINITDMHVPKEKEDLLKVWDEKANEVYKLYYRGFYSEEEKRRLVQGIWTEIQSDVEKYMKDITAVGNDLYTIIDSGARGSVSNLTQITGMKGLVVNPKWEIIELPIKGNYAEGLTPIEYFISAHSWRKGKADTALKTAESGYLTRKLCDACQEVIVREEDCGSHDYLLVSKDEAELMGEDFKKLIYGRVAVEDIIDANNVVLVKEGEMIWKQDVEAIVSSEVNLVKIRSALTCKVVGGVCQKCYGMDLGSRKMVEIGTPVGIIAAQSIWEPATQLTMNTFHTGWVAGKGGGDMTQGIERIKQLFEVRTPKNPAIISPFDGVLHFTEKNKIPFLEVVSEYQRRNHIVKDGYEVLVKKWDYLKRGGAYAQKGASKLKIKDEWKVLEVYVDRIVLWVQEVYSKNITGLAPLITTSGTKVYKGEVLTTGALDIREFKNVVGALLAQKYVIKETKKVYMAQGQELNDKHIEIVVRQLFSKIFVEDSWDSGFIPGTNVNYRDFLITNERLIAIGKRPAQGQRLALGLTNVAKSTESWLSAASFQETIRVMVGASLRWAVDELSDLKSNVIIGRLLPIGEIYREEYRKQQEKAAQ